MPYLYNATAYENTEDSVLEEEYAPEIYSNIRAYEANVLKVLHAEVPDFQAFGVELEYAVPLRAYSDYYAARDLVHSICTEIDIIFQEQCMLKADGSIRPFGFEIVSVPMSVKNLKKVFQKFFDKRNFPEGKFLEVNNSTGMHVHVSSRQLTPLQIYRLMSIMHSEEMHKFFVDRAKRLSRRYAALDSMRPKQIREMIFFGRLKNRSRYTALNTTNDKTIEFRLFRAPLNYAEFCENLELCEALIDFSRDASNSVAENPEVFIEYYTEKYSDRQKKREKDWKD